MRMPARTTSNAVRLAFGRYVARRLRRARITGEEEEVRAATAALSEAGARLGDAELAVSDGLADRDAADDELDDTAKRHRQAIEGRGVNANRHKPYTDIYPDGVAWYLNAPLGDQVSRYELLARRYETFLAADDPVRAEAPLIRQQVSQWTAARAQVEQAELDVAMARAKVSGAVEAWEQTLTRLYFRLAEKYGKAKAERFFPRANRARRPDEVEVEDEGGAPASEG